VKRALRSSRAIVLCSALLATADVRAQAGPADAHIRRGLELREQGNDEQALAEFQQAYESSHSARAEAQMGMAEQALGRWLDAEAHMREALAATADRWIAQHRAGLQSTYEAIASHVGTLEVRGSVVGAQVLVNGSAVGVLPLAAPVRVVAGTVTLRVTAAGYLPVERSVPIEGGGLARETVDLVAAPAGSPAAADSSAVSRIEAPARSTSFPTGAAVIGAAGALSLIGGAIANIVRESRVVIYNSPVCINDGDTRMRNCGYVLNDARIAENLAITGYIAGGALAVVAVVLYVMAPSAPAGATHARVHCGQGPGDLGIACGASF
jgi:hypothetical protein